MLEERDIADARRVKADQLAVAAPLIRLYTAVAAIAIFLFFWLKTEINIWVSSAIAVTIAIVSSRAIAFFVGMFLGRRYGRQLKMREVTEKED